MDTKPTFQTLEFTPIDNQRLAALCGVCNAHLQIIEKALHVKIKSRGAFFTVQGAKKSILETEDVKAAL